MRRAAGRSPAAILPFFPKDSAMPPVSNPPADGFALPGQSTSRTEQAARAALEGRRTGPAALL